MCMEHFLACILTAAAAIETYLRSEIQQAQQRRLIELIDRSGLELGLIRDLHMLRKYRNKWVHVSDPWDNQELIAEPNKHEAELEQMALLAVRTLRRTIYSNQWI
jgi:hypothetical protein